MAQVVDRVGPLLTALAQAAGEVLAPTPERVFVAPGGEVAWDDCCDGMAWSRLVSIAPAGPLGPSGPSLWVLTVGLGALRCVAVQGDYANGPTDAALSADAMQMAADSTALAAVIACSEYFGATLRSWTPLGPSGGCAGGEWEVEIRMGTCVCPEGG